MTFISEVVLNLCRFFYKCFIVKGKKLELKNTSGHYLEWKYRVQITISEQEITETLENFPMKFVYQDFFNTRDVQRNGEDFLFTSDDETTKLPHQIRHWNRITGSLDATVLVPKIIPATKSILFLYYGNLQAEDQQDAQKTWAEYTMQRFYNGDSQVVRDLKFQLSVLEMLFPAGWFEQLRCTNLSGQSKLLKFDNNDWKEFQKDTPQV